MQGGPVLGEPGASAGGGRISLNAGSVFDRLLFSEKEKHSDDMLLISAAKKKMQFILRRPITMGLIVIIF